MDIRQLKTKDIFTLANMLLKVSGEAQEELTTLITSKHLENKDKTKEEQLQDQMDLGLQIFFSLSNKLMEYAEDDLIRWFADLTDMTVEEFYDTEITASLDVIETLSEREDLQNFLSRAFSLYKKMTKSEKGQKES